MMYKVVVPAKAGTHTPQHHDVAPMSINSQRRWLWVPACAGTTPERTTHEERLPPHTNHPHHRGLGGIDAGAAARGRHVLALEETSDRIDRHRTRRRQRRRTGAGEHRLLQRDHAVEAALRIERGGARETELRRRLDRVAFEPGPHR